MKFFNPGTSIFQRSTTPKRTKTVTFPSLASLVLILHVKDPADYFLSNFKFQTKWVLSVNVVSVVINFFQSLLQIQRIISVKLQISHEVVCTFELVVVLEAGQMQNWNHIIDFKFHCCAAYFPPASFCTRRLNQNNHLFKTFFNICSQRTNVFDFTWALICARSKRDNIHFH